MRRLAPLPPGPGSPGRALLRFLRELLVVFAGVYAAFALSNYQAALHDRARRRQVLAVLEERTRQSVANLEEATNAAKAQSARFLEALDKGEMPRVEHITLVSDYGESDLATLLQAGGVELLDPALLLEIDKTEHSVRAVIGRLRAIVQLSDVYILPNEYRGGPEVFYDLATKKLLPPYQWYPKSFGTVVDIATELRKQHEELLAHIVAAGQGADAAGRGPGGKPRPRAPGTPGRAGAVAPSAAE